ncbi:MAG: tetratricopeptide repeat protein [Ignavibacteria bacterium]
MFNWISRLVSAQRTAPAIAEQTGSDAKTCKDRGNAHLARGELDAATACYREALGLDPGYAEAHNNLGSVLLLQRRFEEAEACLTTATTLKPSLAQPHVNLGNLRRATGRIQEAEASFRHVLALEPGSPEGCSNLGLLLQEQGRLDEARTCFEQAIASKPDFVEAHNNLGALLREQGRLDAALACFRRAVELRPSLAEAHNNLGTIAQDQGRFAEAYSHYRNALACRADYAEAMSNALLAAQYDPALSSAEIYDRHLGFAERFEAPLRAAWPLHAGPRDPARRLHVGFVSGDLRNHPVGFFLENVLSKLDRGQVEITLYPTNARTDGLSTRLRGTDLAWRPIAGMSDAEAARQIEANGIDILVDLAGHTADNRLLLFARKPAPVQVSWLYFSTTGLRSMDFLLCDRHVIPPGDERWFVERPWRLPDSYLCFTPPQENADAGPLPALHEGRPTFGCFNNLSKINDGVVRCWSRVLQEIPQSRLFLKSKQLADPGMRESVRARFRACGIEPDRLLLEGPSSRAEYLRAYQRVDLALDPFPFPGGTTTVEALWMGVPVLGRCGDRFIARAGESILRTAGLDEWIATDEADYVAKAVRLASDRAGLAQLRSTLRDTLAASPLCDATRFARNLEQAFRGMWATGAANGTTVPSAYNGCAPIKGSS